MSFDKASLLLYAVTDRTWLKGRTLLQDVEQALKGGVSLLQLREKTLPYEQFLAEAREIKALCKSYGVPLIINDNPELALEVGADGVHVGQSDLEASRAREKLGRDKILGVSAQTLEQALLAEKSGADYLGVGAVFSTSTKKDAAAVSFETLREICSAVKIPVVAIGGIYAHNIEKLKGSGICGVALVSSIFAEENICAAAKNMGALSKKTIEFVK
ncbi:MAG: thiamine phosphate synthase [Oscillospiraceae bacterium]